MKQKQEQMHSPYSSITLTPAGAQVVRSGYPWLRPYHLLPSPLAIDADIVLLKDQKGRVLGTGMFSPQSRLPIRVFSRELSHFDMDFVFQRLMDSNHRRQVVFQGGPWKYTGQPDAYRMVHAEADGLPGLVIDKYGHTFVMQSATRAIDVRKREIAALLVTRFGAQQVVTRDDGSNRDMDGLPREKEIIYGGHNTLVSFHDAGSLMEADVFEDGKTGSFLDQQENHAWCGEQPYIRTGKALDIFTYHGGFALALARAGLSVWAGDENPVAITRAKQNAARNRLSVHFQVRNAFDWLRELESAGETFSFIVVDPPALAKRGQHRQVKESAEAAHRAYKELNLRALRLLEPGGILFTCSCSGSLSVAAFTDIVAEASRDAGRVVQLIERRGAGRDHPPLLSVPETEHLKCLVLRVVA